ncbi:MAG: hypothetical protein ACYCYK_06475 [Candidatus Dormibacteria bacterium]
MAAGAQPPLVLGCGRGEVGTLLAGGSRGALQVDRDSHQRLLGGGTTGGEKRVPLRQALTFLGCDHPARLAHLDLKGGVRCSENSARAAVSLAEASALVLA